jgi:hypothetical protein
LAGVVAITTTARYLDHAFRDWCFHHLRLADVVYLWLDDPAELASPHLPRDPRIRAAPGAQTISGSTHGNMMVRQDENAKRALALCLREGIDWLVHLDSDELLDAPSRAILDYALAPPNGQVLFLNHEVCPQWSCVNPFRDCHHFKLNGKLGFNLYANGKTAVRVGPHVYPRDAHSFAGFEGPSVSATSSSILHYACPSYDRWLAKYIALGDFPDCWWDDPQHRITLSFHVASRDICKRCGANGDFDPARQFWASQVLTPPSLDRLMREGKVGWFAPVT